MNSASNSTNADWLVKILAGFVMCMYPTAHGSGVLMLELVYQLRGNILSMITTNSFLLTEQGKMLQWQGGAGAGLVEDVEQVAGVG